MRLPIRLRMALWYAALLTAVILALSVYLVLRLRADIVGGLDRNLVPAAGQIAHDYRQEGIPEFADSAGTVLHGERAAGQLLGAHGGILTTFGDPVSGRPMLVRADLSRVIAGETIARTRALDRGAPPFRVVARPVRRRRERRAVVVAQSLAPMESSTHRVVVLLALGLPVALLATATAGWWLARRALRPVTRITQTATAIGGASLGERVPDPRTHDEVAELARAFNTMLDRIENAVLGQRRLIADASHELRTPLAAMRAEIDVSLHADDLPPTAAAVLASAREEVDRMSRTVADLLTLAAADEGSSLVLAEPADLGEVAAAVVEALRGWSAAHGVALVLEIDGPAPIMGDPEQLRRAARNLIENGIRYTPAGGTVRVDCDVRGDTAVLEVCDEGPGIPPELHDRIFERFFRADPARGRTTGGSGLGLAITRHIAEAHGGDVRVRALPRGTAFALGVPLGRDPRGPAAPARGAADAGAPARG